MTRLGKRAVLLSVAAALVGIHAPAFAATPQNCLIKIEKTSHRGETEKVKFGTHLRSREDCQTLAKMHKPNFEPEIVSRKKVGFKWKG